MRHIAVLATMGSTARFIRRREARFEENYESRRRVDGGIHIAQRRFDAARRVLRLDAELVERDIASAVACVPAALG